jgi:hypothetical protein
VQHLNLIIYLIHLIEEQLLVEFLQVEEVVVVVDQELQFLEELVVEETDIYLIPAVLLVMLVLQIQEVEEAVLIIFQLVEDKVVQE